MSNYLTQLLDINIMICECITRERICILRSLVLPNTALYTFHTPPKIRLTASFVILC